MEDLPRYRIPAPHHLPEMDLDPENSPAPAGQLTPAAVGGDVDYLDGLERPAKLLIDQCICVGWTVILSERGCENDAS